MKNSLFAPRLFKDLRHYNKEKFMADLMSGLIVGIVALPLAIAFGIASGVSPSQGILTAIIGGIRESPLPAPRRPRRPPAARTIRLSAQRPDPEA